MGSLRRHHPERHAGWVQPAAVDPGREQIKHYAPLLGYDSTNRVEPRNIDYRIRHHKQCFDTTLPETKER